MIAEAMAGRGDKALDTYLRINPSAREELSDTHKCEPYVYAQMIAGVDAPAHGEAKNSWLTGTAAWNYVAITQWILGIRPELDGLRVDPCIPSQWREFSVVREFRGVRYKITVKNPRGVCKGVKSMYVNGRQVNDNLIPTEFDSEEVNVEVVLG